MADAQWIGGEGVILNTGDAIGSFSAFRAASAGRRPQLALEGVDGALVLGRGHGQPHRPARPGLLDDRVHGAHDLGVRARRGLALRLEAGVGEPGALEALGDQFGAGVGLVERGDRRPGLIGGRSRTERDQGLVELADQGRAGDRVREVAAGAELGALRDRPGRRVEGPPAAPGRTDRDGDQREGEAAATSDGSLRRSASREGARARRVPSSPRESGSTRRRMTPTIAACRATRASR